MRLPGSRAKGRRSKRYGNRSSQQFEILGLLFSAIDFANPREAAEAFVKRRVTHYGRLWQSARNGEDTSSAIASSIADELEDWTHPIMHFLRKYRISFVHEAAQFALADFLMRNDGQMTKWIERGYRSEEGSRRGAAQKAQKERIAGEVKRERYQSCCDKLRHDHEDWTIKQVLVEATKMLSTREKGVTFRTLRRYVRIPRRKP